MLVAPIALDVPVTAGPLPALVADALVELGLAGGTGAAGALGGGAACDVAPSVGMAAAGGGALATSER